MTMRFTRALALILATTAIHADAQPAIDLGPGTQPQVAVAGAGEVAVVFGREGSIVIARSKDSEMGKPETIAAPAGLMLGMRRGPRIVAIEGGFIVAAIATEKKRAGEVHVWRRGVGDDDWKLIEPINSVPESAREGLLGIASDGRDRVFITWLDLRSGATEIYGALSTDAGKTFGRDVLVYHSPDGHVCECCHPSACFDADGKISVMFRNWLGGSRDMYLARSLDATGKFDGSATRLGTGTWKLNACPMDGGGLAREGETTATAWQRAGSIFTSSDSATETNFGPGRQPAIAPGILAWTDPKSRLMLRVDGKTTLIADDATMPAVASNGDVKVCVYESKGHVMMIRVGEAKR